MLFFGVYFFVGIVFLAIGLWALIYCVVRERNYNGRASALVLDIVKKQYRSYDSHRLTIHYHPVLEFHANGRYVKNTYFAGSNPCKYIVGQNITVRYDVNNPEIYFIEGEKVTKVLGIIFTIIGTVIIAVGVSLIIYLV